MMKRPIVAYKIFDVVVVPFPFTDQNTDKKRPALVLSDATQFNEETQNCVMAMITSAKNPDWPLDAKIDSLKKAGLPAPSKVRMKLFTLDNRLIIKKIGGLAAKDQKSVKENLKKLMDLETTE
jgi:mRNA-degrading endonuclease toxin of MazEF toxin-antitoxin module